MTNLQKWMNETGITTMKDFINLFSDGWMCRNCPANRVCVNNYADKPCLERFVEWVNGG